MTKTIEQKFKKLSDIEHVLLRPGRYIGSTKSHTAENWFYSETEKKFLWKEVTFNPGLIKLFDEIISNSVDHSKRPEGKHLDSIRVDIDKNNGEITVYDNGGIPVVIHKDANEWLPEMLFGSLKSGSNFDDNDQASLTGQNGEGAGLSNIFSKYFIVETCDGKKRFKMKFSDNNHQRSEAKITDGKEKGFTRITYLPDYERFSMNGIDDDNYNALLKRVVDIAGTNSHLKVYFNGTRIAIKSFEDYVGLYTNEYVYDENESFKVAIAHSKDGFQHVSFVNSTQTHIGGTHIEYLMMQVAIKLRAFFNKKYKIDLKPTEIRPHLMLFVDATIVNPRYSSQTKDELITEARDWKTKFEVSDKMIAKLVKSPVVQSILDWVEAKARAAELAAMREKNKNTDKANLKKIPKFHDATEKDRSKTWLFLCEGDSAQSSVQGGRDPKTQASFPLRGRPINVSATTFAKIKENAEFENVRTLIGLKYGETADVNNLNFGGIVIASDADTFGDSIAGLCLNMFYRLWPEIVKAGKLYRLVTPVVSVEYKKQQLEFFTEHEFEVWRQEHKTERYEYAFLKGLGSSTPEQFEKYLGNLEKYLVQFKYEGKEDDEIIDLCFLKDTGFSDKRKAWLDLE